MITVSSVSASFFAFISLIVFLLFADLLFLFILDMTKSFYIKKLITSINNITTMKILKSTI